MDAEQRIEKMSDKALYELNRLAEAELKRRKQAKCKHSWREWSWHGRSDHQTCEWCGLTQDL